MCPGVGLPYARLPSCGCNELPALIIPMMSCHRHFTWGAGIRGAGALRNIQMESRRDRQLGNATEEIWACILDTRRGTSAHPQSVMLLPWETGTALPVSTSFQSGGNEPHEGTSKTSKVGKDLPPHWEPLGLLR